MIQLTRLNRRPLIVNSDLIEFIESAPDTVLTLVTGEKLVVLETADQIVEMILTFRRRLLPTSLAILPPVIPAPAAAEDGEASEGER
jgi:flagellar protein FlbD